MAAGADHWMTLQGSSLTISESKVSPYARHAKENHHHGVTGSIKLVAATKKRDPALEKVIINMSALEDLGLYFS